MQRCLTAAALLASAAAQPQGPGTIAETCGLRLVMSRAQPASLQTGGLRNDSATWLCCPIGQDESSPHCKVLFGEHADALQDAGSAQEVQIVMQRPEESASRAAVVKCKDVVPALPEGARKAFGKRGAVSPVGIRILPNDDGRRLQSNLPGPVSPLNSGAKPITHWSRFHGKRTLLIVIIDTLVSLSGERRTWPVSFGGCTIAKVNNLMWGRPKGVQFKVGASPWASADVSASCRTQDDLCYYNARDHMLTLSRGAVDLDRKGSVVLKLSEVTGYPNDFCDWAAAWGAIRNAVIQDGTYSWSAYDHRVVFLPSHCAAGQATLPGSYSLNNICPGSGRGAGYPDTIVHELGHNIGLGHARTTTAEYGDGSDVMGNPGWERTASLNLAHRHMFSWLPGLPWSVPALQLVPLESKYFDHQYELADVLYKDKPAGSVWGLELRQSDRSYFASYRSCAGYDYAAQDGWCGSIQISYRAHEFVHSTHVSLMQDQGASYSFGTGDAAATITLLEGISRTTRGSSVSLRVFGKVRPRDEANIQRVEEGVLAY